MVAFRDSTDNRTGDPEKRPGFRPAFLGQPVLCGAGSLGMASHEQVPCPACWEPDKKFHPCETGRCKVHSFFFF